MSSESETIAALQAENEALRKRVAALEQDNEQLRLLVEHMPVMIDTVDSDGQITYWNRECERVTGYSADEIVGNPKAFELFYPDPDYRAKLFGEWSNLVESGHDLETNILTKDGTNKVIVWRSVSQRYPIPGDKSWYIGTDITERKQVENNLRAFKTLVENAPDGIALCTLDGLVTYANDAFGAITGYGEATTGMSIPDFHAAEELDRIGTSIQRAIQGEIWSGELQYHQPDGTLLPTLISVFRITDEAGTIQGLAAIVRDVTQQKRHGVALRNSEERLRRIIEKIPIGICITNEQYCFEYVNPAYCNTYKYTMDELLGQPFTMVVPEDYRPTAKELHDKFMQESQEIPNEWTVVAKGGEPRNILADAAAIIGEDGQPKKVTFVVDITDLKQAQREQQRLQEQVIDAQRAAIRELSTPLIPLSDTVMLMPLIGTIDSNRAQMVMEALLEGIAQYQSDIAILDITGVSVVDTQVANALIQSAQAVRLLGARVILTGIGPAMAQTLVHLGVDLSTLETRGSLQSAVVEALRQQKQPETGLSP